MRSIAVLALALLAVVSCKPKNSGDPSDDDTPACGSWGDGCSDDSDCCEGNGTCVDGACGKELGAACEATDECASSTRFCRDGTCCTYGTCASDGDCCDRGLGYVCREQACCVAAGSPSFACLAGSNPDCCSGNCNDEVCL